MARLNLKEQLTDAKRNGYAIGAFNIFDCPSARAAVDAADSLKTPILLQTSVGTVKKFGPEELFGMMDLMRKRTAVPVLFHLDHCTEPELAKVCIDTGWDSVMIDLSARPLDENIRITGEIKKYAAVKGVCVEGELGVISGVEEEINAEEGELADYETSLVFLEGTGIDAFAPAVGTAHGVYKKEVKLNYDLVRKLSETTAVPVVIHGGTGLSDEQFARLIACGASKINVSTALKYAYINGLKEYLHGHPEEYDPIKLNSAAEKSVRETVANHIIRFKPKSGGRI
ncbi:class II fructose-bisphosphate aldolase [Breznakiella homolactica]|uniref:Class II fructose-bisphosphate aldolase n=1 Tax=Breznakiella homolactica TaxID=2798577 RepID=A0A7T7XKM8_9SPIR|nr:class II fructose-bisphosphate aldolase [Breznakiella homolactica]QQO08101.1 class II fructose-bisphosphate aldolase [Breznakiella homolactica]